MPVLPKSLTGHGKMRVRGALQSVRCCKSPGEYERFGVIDRASDRHLPCIDRASANTQPTLKKIRAGTRVSGEKSREMARAAAKSERGFRTLMTETRDCRGFAAIRPLLEGRGFRTRRTVRNRSQRYGPDGQKAASSRSAARPARPPDRCAWS